MSSVYSYLYSNIHKQKKLKQEKMDLPVLGVTMIIFYFTYFTRQFVKMCFNGEF